MGDLMILPKHTCQLHWWAEVDKPPTTTYTVRPVKIMALAFMEIAGNSIITVLPGMPKESTKWYHDHSIELLKMLEVDMSAIPATL